MILPVNRLQLLHRYPRRLGPFFVLIFEIYIRLADDGLLGLGSVGADDMGVEVVAGFGLLHGRTLVRLLLLERDRRRVLVACVA